MKNKKIATYGLLIALAFIFSYVEVLFPIPVPVPGIKVGLANIVVIIALYTLGGKQALVLSMIRILLVGFTFGNLYSIIYSLAGAILSWVSMVLLKNAKSFSIVGVSILGGVMHNVGQIVVAGFMLETASLIYYLPVLAISGIVAGIVVGILAASITIRLNKIM